MPVPESPKKTATRPSASTLAEQCIDSTPRWGRRSFIRVKIDFLISPAYWVPPIRISWSVRCRITKFPARVPSEAGSAAKLGAWSTRASGRCAWSSSSVGSMKRVRAKRACQALSVTTRSGSRWAGSAPAQASIT